MRLVKCLGATCKLHALPYSLSMQKMGCAGRAFLQLSDSLSGDAEFLTDYFESFRVAAVQSESMEDNLPLAVVQDVQKLTDFVAQVGTPNTESGLPQWAETLAVEFSLYVEA